MLKRSFDIVASVTGLIILFPLFIIISVLIKVFMPKGPVFFKQKRTGYKGELFTIYKFRTMKVNHHGGSVSIKGESRITPLGSFFRQTKLDELPELWNVVIGDMSFVGPRPDVPGYADSLIGIERKILDIRPGITSPASIKYSNEEEILANQENPIKYNNEIIFPDKVRININYINNWSFWLDIKIIIFTLLRKKLKEPYLN